MKTTLDLPPELVREIKLRAVHEGRKLKDLTAELLKRGLKAENTAPPARPHRVKLPLVQCAHPAELSPEKVADLLSQQEVEWHHEAARH